MKVIWKGSWKVAIIPHINDREKEKAISGSCAGAIQNSIGGVTYPPCTIAVVQGFLLPIICYICFAIIGLF